MKNRLLLNLVTADRNLLTPFIEVELPVRMVLEFQRKPIEYAYFPDSGIASVVAQAHQGHAPVEVGIIGREGMTALTVVMGNHLAVNKTFMQVAGSGWRVGADTLRKAIRNSGPLHRAFLRFANAFLIQTAQTAVANATANLEERLARWLLMAQDRIEGTKVELTHEFLATMLAVRRPGVTIALQEFRRRGLIRTQRGAITIIDRKRMIQVAESYYGIAEKDLERLVPKWP